jgi:Uma2 family endonuclease
MVTQLQSHQKSEVIYPDSDGLPMSDNTKQFRWIVVIQQNIEWLFANDPNVFVAGDLLWYPVEGNNLICQAPDIMVAIGRPKSDRGSYMQWKEDNIAPQVVFEILSPSNTQTEMNKKLLFYDRYGVEEYYIYNPDKHDLSGWIRSESRLDVIDPIDNWVSPRLGIKFDNSGEELQIYRPDTEKFASYVEIQRRLQNTEAMVREERQRSQNAEAMVQQERQRAEEAEARAQKLAAKLQSAGIKIDDL